MQFAPDNAMTLPYTERQLIVVASDDAVEELKRTATEEATANRQVDPSRALVATIAGGAIGFAATGGAELWKTWRRTDSANLPHLVVSATQAEHLSFPNGHPRRDVVYVGDPGVASKYYPAANFHRVLFEGKVAEAIRLLRSLGATEISIEYLEGFDRGAGIDLSISPPSTGVDISASPNQTSKTSSRAKTTMHLSPTMSAHIPTDLTWFHSEPLWQEVANARIESGLRSFTLDVNYMDDFGINPRLKAKIAGVGLELGGTFTECRETVWKFNGTFADQLLPDSTSP